MPLLFTLVVCFIILALNEAWWYWHHTRNEYTRKIAHIAIGAYAAFWPFYLPWIDIRFLSLAMLVVVLLSKRFKVFRSIHSVHRLTWGEIYFAIALGLVTYITNNKWIYAAALMQMALADGLAAIIGTKFGKKSRYSIVGNTKSVVGTLTFLVVSIGILITFSYFSGVHLGWDWVALISLLATITENVAANGLDNLVVPVVTSLLLIHR